MKSGAIIAAMVMYLSGVSLVSAEEDMHLSGSDFLSACTKADPDWIGFCHGYVQAVFDGEDNAGCPPAGTTRASIVGAVVAQLQAKPALLEGRAVGVVSAYLAVAFPCS